MTPPSDLTLFIGRFHVLIIHFPIALILVLGLLEMISRVPRWKGAANGSGFLLAIAVPTSIAAALCGWLLSQAGGYDERLLQRHLWTGIATAVGCALAALFYWLNRKPAYRGTLLATLVLLVLASHNGGSLTHGSDYLVKYAPGPIRTALGGRPSSVKPAQEPTAAEPGVFASLIHPMLDKHCVGCHGPEKSKGGLRLDTLQAALAGGDSGPGVVPGKPAESLILQRIRLPLDDDEHMPPDGKPQPSDEQIALLEWWVASGADDRPARELSQPPAIAKLLQERGAATAAPKVSPEPALPSLNTLRTVADKLSADLGVAISQLGEAEPWLQCNASVAGKDFGDDQLQKLSPLAAHLQWLDLAGTGITDTGLDHLASMTNLTRLHLQRTAITDDGLAKLTGLQRLDYLNLYGTKIADAGLDHLRELPKLRQVYLWQTSVTPEAAKAFIDSREDKALLKQWQDEIQQLTANIRNHRVLVDLGTPAPREPAPAAAATAATPINSTCPVSGKAIDATKTAVYQGKLVAFCCDNCKGKFEQDPKPFLAKLGLDKAAE